MTAPQKERKTATLTIRGLDVTVKDQIQRQAKKNGRSMEAQARSILEDAAFPSKNNALIAYPKSDPISALHLSDQTQRRLEDQAHQRGHSVADEVRAILDRGTRPVDAGRIIYELSREYGGFDDFELPERTGSRDIPDFS